MRFHQIISEEVFGKFAVVYHRTHTKENVESIRSDGFQAGDRAMYGSGIYATYSIFSQFTPYMLEQYGEFIIKSRVSLEGFLILDPKVARQVYGAKSSLLDQARDRFKMGRTASESDFEAMQEKIEENPITASIGREILRRGLVRGMRGMVYRGASDGACVVSYENDTILPMAWTRVTLEDVQTMQAAPMRGVAEREFVAGLVWTKVASRALVAKAMQPNITRDLVTNPEAIKRLPNPTPQQQLIAVKADPRAIRHIRNPTPEAQVAAVMGDSDAIDLIANPTPETIVWPLRTRMDNAALLDRLDPETVIAALRISATILPVVCRGNPDKLPSAEQWEAAWHAPDAQEIFTQARNVPEMFHADSAGRIDARMVPHDALCAIMHKNPGLLPWLRESPPEVVAAAALSPAANQFGHNIALGNCATKNIQVDTSAIDPASLEQIIHQTPNCIFAIANASIELVAVAMKASRSVAEQIGQMYDLPPELRALVPKGLGIFR